MPYITSGRWRGEIILKYSRKLINKKLRQRCPRSLVSRDASGNVQCGAGALVGRGATKALLRAGNSWLSALTKRPAPGVVLCLSTKSSWSGKEDCGGAASPASLQKAKLSQAASRSRRLGEVSHQQPEHPKINTDVFFVPCFFGRTPCAGTGWYNLPGPPPGFVLELEVKILSQLGTLGKIHARKGIGKLWEQSQLSSIRRAGEGTVKRKIRAWGCIREQHWQAQSKADA